MDELGVAYVAVAPDFDERSIGHLFASWEPGQFALELARRKALSVADRFADAMVLAADQIAVLRVDGIPTLLHQPGTAANAVAQLVSMSGTTHELINGVVVFDTATKQFRVGVDRHVVVMRAFGRSEAEAYVEQFAPLDCAGSYRIEDDADLVAEVNGGDRSGVIGLPLPLVRVLLGLEAPGHDMFGNELLDT